jgi:hypothetical protein
VTDPFLAAAGPAPARAPGQRWRQVALLGVPAAQGDPRARAALAGALLALDHPAEAGRVAAAAADDPWARWWTVLAVGQLAGAEGLDEALAAAQADRGPGPDGREVARRLRDLADELAAIRGTGGEGARFSLLGHRARPERRVLVGGRSSASFVLEPAWESVRLVRLGPSDGPTQGNGAHHALEEVIGHVRDGHWGQGRPVPGDAPPDPDPDTMLGALREDSAARDRRLIELAEEVREERERLAGERVRLEREWADVQAERARLGRARREAPKAGPRAVPRRPPTTRAEAASILGVADGASAREVERCWREAVVRCHPDRVADLHPQIRAQAEQLTVALNAARDLLLDRAPVRRRASSAR